MEATGAEERDSDYLAMLKAANGRHHIGLTKVTCAREIQLTGIRRRKGALASLLALTLAAGTDFTWSADTPVSPASQSDASESRTISSIDFYGLRRLNADALRKSLTIHEGDVFSRANFTAFKYSPEKLLGSLPPATRVRVEYVCCDERGGLAVFIGVHEPGSPQLEFRPAPRGSVRLPADLVRADADVQQAVFRGGGQRTRAGG